MLHCGMTRPDQDDADRRLRMFHSSCLYGRGVSAKYDVLFHIFLIGFDEESILHITCRMVFGKIHGSEYVQVVFYFGTVGNTEAQPMEYINDSFFTMLSGWRVPSSMG